MRLRAQGERWVVELLSTLAKLTQRIEAIERHLGITEGTSPEAEPTGNAESADQPQPADSETPPAAANAPDPPVPPAAAAEEG